MFESVQQAEENGDLIVVVNGVEIAPTNGSWLVGGETGCPSPMVTSMALYVCGK